MKKVLRILIYPHEILSTPAKAVTKIDGRFQAFVDDMITTMYAAKGVGLAANQVGSLDRVLVVDVGQEQGPRNPLVIVNPVVTATDGSEKMEEGCLSVPGYSASLVRPARIEVKGFDRHGKEIRLEGDGLFARCVLHELDHLDGTCFVERLSPLKKRLFRKKWARIRPKEDSVLATELYEGEG